MCVGGMLSHCEAPVEKLLLWPLPFPLPQPLLIFVFPQFGP